MSDTRETGAWPQGALVRPLKPNPDARGWLTEIHRDQWLDSVKVVQWDAVHSRPNALRGLHAHLRRYEIYVLVRGRALLKMRDIRRGSPTEGALAEIEVDGERPCAVHVPAGLLHGILLTEESMLLVGFSRYYDPVDEQGVIWNDPDTGIVWPCTRPILSDRDAALPSLREYLRTHRVEFEGGRGPDG